MKYFTRQSNYSSFALNFRAQVAAFGPFTFPVRMSWCRSARHAAEGEGETFQCHYATIYSIWCIDYLCCTQSWLSLNKRAAEPIRNTRPVFSSQSPTGKCQQTAEQPADMKGDDSSNNHLFCDCDCCCGISGDGEKNNLIHSKQM